MRHPFSLELSDLEIFETVETANQEESTAVMGGMINIDLISKTTNRLGEEGGGFDDFLHCPPRPHPRPQPIHPPLELPGHPSIRPRYFDYTTHAIGEEGGGWLASAY